MMVVVVVGVRCCAGMTGVGGGGRGPKWGESKLGKAKKLQKVF